MSSFSNRTKIKYYHTSSGAAGITGSIQKIYAPQGTEIDRIEFGYWERVGSQTGSKAIITSTLAVGDNMLSVTGGLKLEANATLEGPIVSFRTSGSASSTPVIVPKYSSTNRVILTSRIGREADSSPAR